MCANLRRVHTCSIHLKQQGNYEDINRKHLDIRGCWGSEVGHFLRAIAALERYGGEIPWQKIGARTYSLTQINDALAAAESMAIPKALIDPWR